MARSEREFERAEARTHALRQAGYAISAHYDRRTSRVVVRLNTGVQVTFPARSAEGLADASPDDLAEIESCWLGLALAQTRRRCVRAGTVAMSVWLEAMDGRSARHSRRKGAYTRQGRGIA